MTFVRPKGGIREVTSTPTEYSVQDGKATRRRLEEQDSLGLAQQRLRVGDLATAEREASKALKLNPQSSAAYTLLAVIADRRGQSKEAGERYRRAAELSPNDGGMLNNYGAWLCGNGFAAEALVWFDRSIATPGYGGTAGALANAGGCALQTGQYERVETDLRKALALDPKNAYALVSMARNEYRLGHYMAARAFIERRLTAAPVDAGVLQLAADIESKLGDMAAAEKYRQRQRAEFPDATAGRPGESARP
ncbi:type IV pilus biogenesis/stability protein PilW [Pseudoxanthomonas sp.]|uniref:type IV pilus biogenesis/stability protein PilW n=1 Tax=Pseudoxanthomonas sp. TaxID=1871049 RepID=UPI002603BBB2|nr:type IV pilus biogenesis/stability protein PilW [Pseudoxanthomonas sp.]WDS37042.1 MAG: type IV pilus biogenesis/stability protein PilW [Pseudoxanthomonas sp.]